MRIRDLRWHILAAIILIIAYGAVTLCYYLSVKAGKVETSMKAIALEVSKARSDEASSKINNYYDIFVNDNTNSMVKFLDDDTEDDLLFEECKTQSRLVNRFNNIEDKKILIARDSIFNPQNTSEKENSNFYVYFQKDYEDTKLTVRILASEFFDFENYNMVVFDDTNIGSIIYSSYNNTQILNATMLFGANYLDYFVDDTLSRVYTINGESSVVSGIKFNDFKIYLNSQGKLSGIYITTIISTSDALLGSDWIITQALISFYAGVITMVLMLILMIFGVKRTKDLLRADRRSLRKSKAIAIRINPSGEIIYTNDIFKKTFGITELKNINELKNVNGDEDILKDIKDNKSFISKLVDNDNKTRYLELVSLYISNSYYLMGNEVTLDYERRVHLEEMCGKNEFTHCDNSFMLENRYETLFEISTGDDIAFIEYNIYKYDEIISTYGQTNFIELLNVYLDLLRNIYPDSEIYHITNSKFMVIYYNTGTNQITSIVEKSLEQFEKPVTVRDNNIYIKSKIMIYNFKRVNFDDKDKISLDEIRRKLDLAYMNIKSISSKDYVIYDKTMDNIIEAIDEMEKDITIGLENNEFEMYLQPQFDIIDNKVVGAEALLRWNNPKYKSKSPQVYVELAEQRGHMLDIGRFVISESFKLAKKLEQYNITISVNISPIQLLQAGFVKSLIDEFDKNELKDGSIAIELTETLLMENFDLIKDKLKLLRARGFKIHLDDFLTGYSSMLYLKDLPIDTLKIDKNFTKNVDSNKTNEAIIKAITNLGLSLNLGLIVEGVETVSQRDTIKKLGCRIIQGYLISRPEPFDKALELIKKYDKSGGKK